MAGVLGADAEAGSDRGKRAGAPGPGGLGFGRLVARMRDALGFYEGLRKKFGEVVGFRILHRRFVVTFGARAIREVMVEKEACFEKGPAVKKTLVLKNPTTVTADGEDHRRMREAVQPSFRRSSLEGYAREMVREAESVVGSWRDGSTLDAVQAAREFSGGVARAAFFGRDSGVDVELLEQTIAAMRWSMALTLVPGGGWLAKLPLAKNRAREAVCRRMDAAIEEAVRKAMGDGEREDLVSALVRARNGDGGRSLRVDELRDEVYAELVAGYITPASAIGWCLWHLSGSPGCRRRLEAEVDSVVGEKGLAAADYRDLKYAQAVVSEALRLRPPVYAVGRRALVDCEIGGFRVRRGTTVQAVWWALQRDPGFFDAAEEFRPERWLGEVSNEARRRAYMPFGAGPRVCLGAAFAKMEVVLFLAAVAGRWRVDPLEDGEPDVLSFGTYGFRNGLPVRVRSRRGGQAGQVE